MVEKRKVKIVSDGHKHKVTLDNGDELTGVRNAIVIIKPNQVPVVQLEIAKPKVDIIGKLKEKEV